MPETYRNYVDGEWVACESGATFENRNPADHGDVIGLFQQSSAADAERAVEAAAAAQEEWAARPGPERARHLDRTAQLLAERADELTETLVREEGKTWDEAEPEVQRTVDTFNYYAWNSRDFSGKTKESSFEDTNLYTVHEPLGVAGLVTPWNYPIAIPAYKIATALVTGNAIVFKPASLAPAVSRTLFECMDEAGFPDGVANYVTGPGSEVGDAIVTHDLVDAVSFTGSAAAGNAVHEKAAVDQKRVQLELGGKNPTVVMPSADLDEAADIVAGGGFGVTGQACTATSRAIVHEAVVEEFTEALVERAEAIAVGSGLDDETDMGPQVSERELEGTLDYVQTGIEEGATLETGGGTPDGAQYEGGNYVEPTVFSDVESEMTIAQEEIFGPVVGVIEVGDFEEAVAVANDVDYGLAASIVTNDLDQANRFVEATDVGIAKVNKTTPGQELHVPFGGMKGSSSETYREQGEAGLEFFTITKTVYMGY